METNINTHAFLYLYFLETRNFRLLRYVWKWECSAVRELSWVLWRHPVGCLTVTGNHQSPEQEVQAHALEALEVTILNCSGVELQVEVKLRQTDRQWPVRLGVRHPSGALDQFFFLLEIFFRQLRVCYFVAPSRQRGRVCKLLLLLAPTSAVLLGSQSRRTPQDKIYCLNSWNSPNLKGQVPTLIAPRNRVAKLYPRALGSLYVASYDSQGYGGGILTRLHTGLFGCSWGLHF
jgi:hypothetical protein